MLAAPLQRLLAYRSTFRLATSQTRGTSRTFSTTSIMTTSDREWIVIVPDKPNALQKRLATRPIHLEKLQPKIEVGQVVFGGAMLSEQPPVDGTPDMIGSVMLIKADTEEEARAFLENDEYTKQGVWDVEKAKISPFRCAVRTAM